jgi:hypothetical protein
MDLQEKDAGHVSYQGAHSEPDSMDILLKKYGEKVLMLTSA